MAVICGTSRRQRARALRWSWKRSEGRGSERTDAGNPDSAGGRPCDVSRRAGASLENESDLKVVGQCSSTPKPSPLLKTGVTMVLLDVDLGAGSRTGIRRSGQPDRLRGPDPGSHCGHQRAGSGAADSIGRGRDHAQAAFERRAVLDRSAEWRRANDGWRRSIYRRCSGLWIAPASPSRPKLTERDRSVLRSILQGLSNKDIATRLSISEGAVKASIRQLFEKLGSRTRAQLVRIALEQYKDEL